MDREAAPVSIRVIVERAFALIPHRAETYGRPDGANDALEDERAGASIVDGDRHRALRVARLVVRELEVKKEARDEDGREPAREEEDG